MMIRTVGSIAFSAGCGLVLAGCVMRGGMQQSAAQRLSAGKVGCPPQKIEIKDESQTVLIRNWTAVCHGKVFYCGGVDESHIDCKAAIEPASAPSAAPAK